MGITYTENDAPTQIDSTMTLADPDSPDYASGTLVADYTSGGTVDDRLTIRNQGVLPGQVSVYVQSASACWAKVRRSTTTWPAYCSDALPSWGVA